MVCHRSRLGSDQSPGVVVKETAIVGTAVVAGAFLVMFDECRRLGLVPWRAGSGQRSLMYPLERGRL